MQFSFKNPLLMSFLIFFMGTTFLPSLAYAMEPIELPDKGNAPPQPNYLYPGMVGIIENSQKDERPYPISHNLRLISAKNAKEALYHFSIQNLHFLDKLFLLGTNLHIMIAPREDPSFQALSHIVFANGTQLSEKYGLHHTQTLCSLNSNGADCYVFDRNSQGKSLLNLYKNQSPSPCAHTWAKIKSNGFTFEYTVHEDNKKNYLTVSKKKTIIKRHEMRRDANIPLDSGAFFHINWDFTIYFYDPFSHALLKISRNGALGTPHRLPAGRRFSRNFMPGALHYQSSKKKGVLINAEGNPIEFNTGLAKIEKIEKLRSTLSPPWAIYGYGPHQTTKKDTIFTVDLKGHVTLRGDFELTNIQGIEPGLNGTLYIHGFQGKKNTVLLLKNNSVIKHYDATDECKIVGIRALQGYGAMPKILKEFKGPLSPERIINLCSALKTIVPMYSDGPAFYKFFIPIAAQQNAGNTLEALDELFQTYKNTSIDGYARIFIFKRSGGMDTIYKADPSTTTEQFLAQTDNKIDSDCFQKTLDAQEQLQKITHFMEGPLKNAYDKKLESVNKAVEILLNLQTK